ncbi:hypothetical protein BCR34DRAFT_637791 [Clohesyomyces aquaticus]|uniref:Ribonuclease H1 N-terminal domain-containing protein n=1 Tax=Clohesyomyces aquaticus TaxID=1231657 RepID=A0A1Y1YRS9_9PLEO|nr:hypothetical protein BCR34DRAFT_637791 [Clohesyomyces aquaticus]
MVRRKNKEYYAVFQGRVDEPTIFSSWGDAHPRAIGGCSSQHSAFVTIKEAREYMMKKGTSTCKEVIKSTTDTTPEEDSMGFMMSQMERILAFARPGTGKREHLKTLISSTMFVTSGFGQKPRRKHSLRTGKSPMQKYGVWK